jgi:transcriptional regulator with XRE-family HTH domain
MNFKLIKQSGLTQQEVADALGVTRITVNNWVTGRCGVNVHLQKKVGTFLAALRSAIDTKDLPVYVDPLTRSAQITKVLTRHVKRVKSEQKEAA